MQNRNIKLQIMDSQGCKGSISLDYQINASFLSDLLSPSKIFTSFGKKIGEWI